MKRKTWIHGAWPFPLVAGAATLLVVASVAAEPAAGTSAPQPKVSITQVLEVLEGKGYQNVHDLEWEGGAWEVEATDPSGNPVDLVVNGDTGDVVTEQPD